MIETLAEAVGGGQVSYMSDIRDGVSFVSFLRGAAPPTPWLPAGNPGDGVSFVSFPSPIAAGRVGAREIETKETPSPSSRNERGYLLSKSVRETSQKRHRPRPGRTRAAPRHRGARRALGGDRDRLISGADSARERAARCAARPRRQPSERCRGTSRGRRLRSRSRDHRRSCGPALARSADATGLDARVPRSILRADDTRTLGRCCRGQPRCGRDVQGVPRSLNRRSRRRHPIERKGKAVGGEGGGGGQSSSAWLATTQSWYTLTGRVARCEALSDPRRR